MNSRECGMHAYGGVMALTATVVLAMAATGAAAMDGLRVLHIQPRCFEYKLMSYMESGRAGYRLAFNDFDGATHIVHEGKTLGAYVVTNFQPLVVRAFNPTINATQETKSAVVTLRREDGEEYILKMGETLTVDGWMACLVDITSGAWQFVRSGDSVAPMPDKVLRVAEVTGDRVEIDDGKTTFVPDWLAEDEHEALTNLWAERDRARREARPTPEPDPEPDPLRFAAPVPAPARAWRPRREIAITAGPPRIMYGTDYPFPTAFEVIPVPVRTASGHIVYRGLPVPVRFERRMSGHRVQVYDR